REPDADSDAGERVASRLVSTGDLEVRVPGEHAELAVELDSVRDAPRADRGEAHALDVDDVVVQHGRADERSPAVAGRMIAEAVIAALQRENAAEGVTA